jgi:BASS family bile acid:Na+ symporter
MVERLTTLLLTVTLVEMMAAVGLRVTFGELARVARSLGLVGRAAVANYACVPAATVGLLLLFDASPKVAAGFLILAACPGAPFGPPVTGLARGNVTVAVGLMVLLAGSSAVVAPVLLQFLLPLLSGDEPLRVEAAPIIVTLLGTQLAPLCAGVVVRQWFPALAGRLLGPADRAAKVLNLAVIGLILATQFGQLAAIRPRGFAGMAALLVVSWAAGWLFGGPDRGVRRAMTLTTSLRNVGVGLVIANGAFAGTPAVTAALAYGLFEVFGSLLLALAWARRGAPTADATEGMSVRQPVAAESAIPDPGSL